MIVRLEPITASVVAVMGWAGLNKEMKMSTAKTPRGIRNNNTGNIEWGSPWQWNVC